MLSAISRMLMMSACESHGAPKVFVMDYGAVNSGWIFFNLLSALTSRLIRSGAAVVALVGRWAKDSLRDELRKPLRSNFQWIWCLSGPNRP
jgi:hypothetical protein